MILIFLNKSDHLLCICHRLVDSLFFLNRMLILRRAILCVVLNLDLMLLKGLASLLWCMCRLSVTFILTFTCLALTITCVFFKYLWPLFFILAIVVNPNVCVWVTFSTRLTLLCVWGFILFLSFIVLLHELVRVYVWPLISWLRRTLSPSWRSVCTLLLLQDCNFVFKLENLLLMMIIGLLDFIWRALKFLHQNFGVLRNLWSSWWRILHLSQNVLNIISTMLSLIYLLNDDGSSLLPSVRAFIPWVACHGLVTRRTDLRLLISFLLFFILKFCLFSLYVLLLFSMILNLLLILCDQVVLNLSVISPRTTICSHWLIATVVYVLCGSKIELFLTDIYFIVYNDTTDHFSNILLVSHTLKKSCNPCQLIICRIIIPADSWHSILRLEEISNWGVIYDYDISHRSSKSCQIFDKSIIEESAVFSK